MFRKVLLGLLSLFPFKALASTGSCEDTASPKATHAIYVGTHIENLAAKENINLQPVNSISELSSTPVWVSLAPDSSKPLTYDDLFWEIEPMGEYVYHLAGDYQKNEKGLLRFPTATTSARVELNFEDDVIEVASHDGAHEQGIAEQQAEAALFVVDLTINELLDRVPASKENFDDRVSFVSFKSALKKEQTGLARLVVHKPFSGSLGYVSIIYEEHRPPSQEGEFSRYLKIEIRSSAQEVRIESLVNEFLELVNIYSNMPYACVTGATRA